MVMDSGVVHWWLCLDEWLRVSWLLSLDKLLRLMLINWISSWTRMLNLQ